MKKTYLKGFALVACGALLLFRTFSALSSPIYSDEIFYSILFGRYWIDGPLNFVHFPQCFPPGFTLPLSFAQHLCYSIMSLILSLCHNPYQCRYVGLGFFCLFLGSLFYWVKPLVKESKNQTVFLCGLLFFASQVPFPFLIAFFRPEWIYLGPITLAGALLFPLCRKGTHRFGRLALSSFLVIFSLGVHANALFFVPLLFIGIWRNFENRIWASVALLVGVVLVGDQILSAHLWSSCPQDRQLGEVIRDLTLLGPHGFTVDGVGGTLVNFLKVISQYFLNFPKGFLNQYGWNVGVWVDSTSQIQPAVFLVAGTIGFVFLIKNLILSGAKGTYGILILFGLVCLGTLGFYTEAKFYYLPIFFAGLVFFYSFCFGSSRKYPSWVSWGVVIFFGFGLGFSKWGAEPAGAFRGNRYWLPGQYLSTDQRDSSDVRRSVEKAIIECSFPTGPLKGLVVDDITYFPLRDRLRNPLHAFYVSRSTYASRIVDLEAFLRSLGSSGVVARCGEFEGRSVFSRTLKRVGELCCLKLEG